MTLKDCVWCMETVDLDDEERRRKSNIRLEPKPRGAIGLFIGRFDRSFWSVIDEDELTVAEGFWCTHECFIRWVEWQLHRARTETTELRARQAR